MLSNIFILCIVICIIILVVSNFKEMYGPDSSGGPEGSTSSEACNPFPEQNPKALKHGKIIGGSVYSDYPTTVPGLGWIL